MLRNIDLTKKHLLYITIAYFMAHVLLLFVNGIWWDDWIMYDANRDFIHWGYMMGRPSFGYVTMFIRSLPHPEAFLHILVFLLYYISTISLYFTLMKMDFLDNDAPLFITVLFATTYVNEARVLFACFPYAISNMIFFFAFYLFVLWKDSATKSLIRLAGRITILLLFFASFSTNSFLVFYSILLIYILYKEKDIKCYIKYFDFVVLPFAFFAIKQYYWPTFGYYINYNTITFEGINLAIRQLPQGIWHAYIYSIIGSINFNSELYVLFFLIILVIIDRLLLKKDVLLSNRNIKNGIRNLLLGIFFLMIAIFPYLILFSVRILKGLNFNSFDTRHLLLAPLGVAWITYFMFRCIFHNKKILVTALLVIISLNVIYWNKAYLMYELYWYKQCALTYLFKNEQFIKDNDTFAFIDLDKTTHNSSIYAFYSLAGILKQAYGDERRLMFRIEDYEVIQGYGCYFNKDYLLGDYTGDHIKIDGTIYFESDLTLKDIPALRYYDFIQSDSFETSLQQKSRIKLIKPIND